MGLAGTPHPGWIERLGRRRGPASVDHRGGERWQVVAAPARSAGLGLGLAWVAWPCGLLQSALLVAALANTLASGALVMAGFAGASAAGLLLGPALWWRLSGGASDLRVVFMSRPKNNNAHREWLVFCQPQRPSLRVRGVSSCEAAARAAAAMCRAGGETPLPKNRGH